MRFCLINDQKNSLTEIYLFVLKGIVTDSTILKLPAFLSLRWSSNTGLRLQTPKVTKTLVAI
jgi:hypothetical protein